MIVVRLMGGLGNQMFQYAMGRRVAEESGTPLKLDLSWFLEQAQRNSDTTRSYELGVFNISATIASKEELARFKVSRGRFARVFERLTRLFLPSTRPNILRERQFAFDASILGNYPDAYLDGYWQSEKYFKAVEPVIRAEFAFTKHPDSKNRELAEKIVGVDAVSLHVRRGDYVLNPATHNFHGTCSLDYYREAISLISQTVSNPHFFIFSDDLAWVKQNLVLEFPATYVTHNQGDKSYEDLRLMSLCKHHIIANSSFSWWGAWLASNKRQTVIAPAKWFNRADIDTSDLIPENWIRI